MNENKVYGNLNMIELLLEEHRKGKLSLKDLTRSLNKRMGEINKEVLGK